MRYHYEIHDNVVNASLQEEVWNYIQTQKFWAARKNANNTTIEYYPINNNKEYMQDGDGLTEQYMHRCIFGDNETDLLNHPPILKLWICINKHLKDQFKIAGCPEGIAIKAPKSHKPVTSRVYVNAQPSEKIKKTHTIHRDSIELHDDKNYTLLYIANKEWHPSWFAENIFYESDEDSNDKQQYQKGFGQSRGFGIGDPYATILPRSGRVIVYDSRTLHTTKPAAIWAEEMRYAVAFRIRKKN